MNVRRIGLGGLASAAVVVVAATTAFACVSGPVVNLSTVQAKAGEEVTLNGTGFRQPEPVLVRFNAVDGPLLATLPPPKDRNVTGSITVPASTPAGTYVLVVSQVNAAGQMTQAPIRTLLTVVGPSGQTPIVGAPADTDDAVRSPALARVDNSVSSGTLALIALGFAGLGLFSAGVAALLASRRGSGAAVPESVARR